MNYQINTRCIHGNHKKSFEPTGAISFPIYQTATFSHPSVGTSTGYDYSRAQNPTREQLEKVLASLEYADYAFAFSSGMAAVSALMELFAPDDHIIATDDLYGGSVRIFEHIHRKNGLHIDFCDTSDLINIEHQINRNTKAIYLETPTNPMMNVSDIKEIAGLAKKYNLLLIVDNTFLSPYYQNPIVLGADIVIHSGTKFLGGHNDTLAGFLVTSDSNIAEQLRFIEKTTGAGLSPFDSWLLLRGIKTLAIRMDYQQKNAFVVADFLLNHPKITNVYYIGLESHKGHHIQKNQSSGFGSMISFHVDTKDTAYKLLNHVKLIQYAESLGGVESLITYPMLQTHADIPKDIREKAGINDRLLRLSVGIESIEDLISDLEQALSTPI